MFDLNYVSIFLRDSLVQLTPLLVAYFGYLNSKVNGKTKAHMEQQDVTLAKIAEDVTYIKQHNGIHHNELGVRVEQIVDVISESSSQSTDAIKTLTMVNTQTLNNISNDISVIKNTINKIKSNNDE